MTLELDHRIRTRAYEIWEREGRPDGRDVDHWVMAQQEIFAQSSGTLQVAAPVVEAETATLRKSSRRKTAAADQPVAGEKKPRAHKRVGG